MLVETALLLADNDKEVEYMNGISDFTGFLNGQANSVDINTGISSNLWLYNLVGLILVVVGMALLAVYVLRQVAAMAYIVMFNGGNVGKDNKFGKFVAKWAPGTAEKEDNIIDYMKHNIKEIIATFICVYLIFSLTIFNIVSFAMSGLAFLMNKLLNTDVAYYESAIDAATFGNNVAQRRSQDLYQEYQKEIPKIQQNLEMLYSMKDGSDNDPKFAKAKANYTRAMARAEIDAKELNSRQAAVKEFSLPADYFSKHKKTSGEYGMCNSAFFSEDIMVRYGVTLSCEG